jgi:transcription termination factor Rho
MSILDRSALEDSPLADLHAIASELSIDGYRRLRRADLIDAILSRQGASPQSSAEAEVKPVEVDAGEPVEALDDELPAREEDAAGVRRRRGRRGGRGRSADRDEDRPREPELTEIEEPVERAAAEEIVEGLVELLPNGSGFMRVHPPEPSEEDVYISAAQVKRCELISGDRISGPRRTPRRSERFASLIRIDTINDRPAADAAGSTRFEDLPAAFPSEHFRLGSEDPTIKAIEWLTPFGRGSRVTIVGAPQAGKTQALRRLAAALGSQEDIQLSVVLAGVRPEEVSDWGSPMDTAVGSDGERMAGPSPVEPIAAVSFAASADAQAQAVDRAIDQARRMAARGAHTVVLIDTLQGLHPHAALKTLAAARNVVDGGSLTVIATAPRPLGGETTVIALEVSLAGAGRFPAVDLAASWTMRPELLVGEAGAEAIARARAEAIGE